MELRMNSGSDQTTGYMQQVIDWQPRLYSFILSLLGNLTEAEDVLQNTNLVLIQQQEAFCREASFSAWAMKIAYHQVLQHRDSNVRSRLRFDDALLDQLAAKLSDSGDRPASELAALHQCVLRLSPVEQDMLKWRYGGKSLSALAEKLGRTVGSVSQTLYRTRAKLAECIKRALKAEYRNEP
jgi:RNA polymerase sigma-70 factor, ECF subfamily